MPGVEMRAVRFDGDHQWRTQFLDLIPEGPCPEGVDLEGQYLVCVLVDLFHKGETIAAIDLSRYIQGFVGQDGGDELIKGFLADGLFSRDRDLAADKPLEVLVFFLEHGFKKFCVFDFYILRLKLAIIQRSFIYE
jgi:hypothetical protein